MRTKVMSLSVEGGDFRVETFRAGGKGGQHQNTTDSGVRIVHVATGLSAESVPQFNPFDDEETGV